MEIEIIKTDNPDVVIERRIQEKEINIMELKDNLEKTIFDRDNIIFDEIDENYPENIKSIIKENNIKKYEQKIEYDFIINNLQNKIDILCE